MAIKVVCSACLRRLTFKHAESGLNRKCPGCGAELTVPGEALPVVAGGKPPRSEYDTRKIEFVIAGIILVAALLGAYFFIKWVQQNQPARNISVDTGSSSSQSVANTKKNVVKPPVNKSAGKPISVIMKAHEDIKLGMSLASVTNLTTAKETPILRSAPAKGKTFAVVRMELKSVDSSRLFDTYQLFLMSPDGVQHDTVAVVGTDGKGPYEVPAKRVNSTDIAAGAVKFDVYFPVAVDPATGKPDLDTLELRYK